MSHARETTLTFFVMYLSTLMSKVYLFEKPVHNAVRRFSCFSDKIRLGSSCIVCTNSHEKLSLIFSKKKKKKKIIHRMPSATTLNAV